MYVGTYGKYNSGSLRGAWLDITKFADYDEFLAVCRYLHRDEADPEFMFQDFENFPREWYSESGISEEVFNNIQAYGDLSADEKEAFDVYINYKGYGHCDDERILTISVKPIAVSGTAKKNLPVTSSRSAECWTMFPRA